jgi:hypothetical protein
LNRGQALFIFSEALCSSREKQPAPHCACLSHFHYNEGIKVSEYQIGQYGGAIGDNDHRKWWFGLGRVF